MKSEAIVPVSKKIPLLSNLSIIENIALIKEIHWHLSYKKAKHFALEALEKTGFAYIGSWRSAQCSERELFIAQLIRASMMQYAKIIIITPFVLLNETEEIAFLFSSCEKLGIKERCIILDLESNRVKYEKGGSVCRIIE